MYYDYHDIKHPDVKQVDHQELDDQPSYELGDEIVKFGYETVITKSLVEGELAQRIRRALGEAEDSEVYITEKTGDASYSEYTQEQYSEFTVECGYQTQEFNYNGFNKMLEWLDKEAPVK